MSDQNIVEKISVNCLQRDKILCCLLYLSIINLFYSSEIRTHDSRLMVAYLTHWTLQVCWNSSV